MKLQAAAIVLALHLPVAAALPEGMPLWPEDLGRVSRDQRDRWLPELGGRIGEEGSPARLGRALLLLLAEPGRDPRRAREDLDHVVDADDAAWTPVARYALAWLDEEEGRVGRATDAYQRLCVDHPGTEAAAHAAVRLALAHLRDGRAGPAAAWLETAGGRAPPNLRVSELREAAVRRVLRDSRSGGRWDLAGAKELPSQARGDVAIARGSAGSLVVVDRKAGSVLRLDGEGGVLDRWEALDPTAVAVDPHGRTFVASGSSILELDRARGAPFAGQGSFGPASSIALDAAGDVYLVDRRGARLGIVEPGGEEPRVLREKKGSRLAAIAWDGRRLLALQQDGALLSIASDGSERVLAGSVVEDPIALAVRPGGEVLCLGRSGVVVVDPQGREQDRIETRSLQGFKASAMAPGWDGAVDLYDKGTGRIVRVP